MSMNAPSTDVRLVISTAPDSPTAERLAEHLVSTGLAACVNLLPGVLSIYRWQGVTHRDAELLLVVKTVAGRADEVVAAIEREHPYDCPEALVVAVEGGSTGYLDWVRSTVAGREAG
jgi:periplasmic divalent cation tolerance protein